MEPDDDDQPIHRDTLTLYNDIELLWVNLKQVLQLKVGCSNFDPISDTAIYSTC